MTKAEAMAKIAEDNGYTYTAKYIKRYNGLDMYPWTMDKAHAKKLNDTLYKECIQKGKTLRELHPEIFETDVIY